MAFSFTFPYHFCFISAPQNDDVWFLCEEIAHTVSSTEIGKFSFNCEKLVLWQPKAVIFYFPVSQELLKQLISLQNIIESKICFVKDPI